MKTLKNNNIVTGYYGKDGAMTDGWDTEEEALDEFENFYSDDEYEDCEVIQYNGKWVIAY